jgi:hypothetical protein
MQDDSVYITLDDLLSNLSSILNIYLLRSPNLKDWKICFLNGSCYWIFCSYVFCRNYGISFYSKSSFHPLGHNAMINIFSNCCFVTWILAISRKLLWSGFDSFIYPEGQHIKTNQQNILIRALKLKNVSDNSKKRYYSHAPPFVEESSVLYNLLSFSLFHTAW